MQNTHWPLCDPSRYYQGHKLYISGQPSPLCASKMCQFDRISTLIFVTHYLHQFRGCRMWISNLWSLFPARVAAHCSKVGTGAYLPQRQASPFLLLQAQTLPFVTRKFVSTVTIQHFGSIWVAQESDEASLASVIYPKEGLIPNIPCGWIPTREGSPRVRG